MKAAIIAFIVIFGDFIVLGAIAFIIRWWKKRKSKNDVHPVVAVV